ncbi:MAG TPA: hypothetical protein PLL72_03640 [Burkholderiaceae bacterium]|nr:hypothetical protein [Burkholderiaceae bacterium]
MSNEIPSVTEVRARLADLSLAQLDELAAASGVPCPTIYKIKYGQTRNPGIETVRRFIGHIDRVLAPTSSVATTGTPGPAPTD